MHSDIAVIAVAGLFVALGGFVQSGIGLGLGLIGAPIVTLLAPALMPGSMLVAGASLFDPNFRRTVVLVGEHNEEGALGLVLNRQSPVAVEEAAIAGVEEDSTVEVIAAAPWVDVTVAAWRRVELSTGAGPIAEARGRLSCARSQVEVADV